MLQQISFVRLLIALLFDNWFEKTSLKDEINISKNEKQRNSIKTINFEWKIDFVLLFFTVSEESDSKLMIIYTARKVTSEDRKGNLF